MNREIQKLTLGQWLSGMTLAEKQADHDAFIASLDRQENERNGKAERSERTFMPDLNNDDDRRKITDHNREKLLRLQWERGQTDPEAMKVYIRERYLTPNPSNSGRIVIPEAEALYKCLLDIENHERNNSRFKYWDYEQRLAEKRQHLEKVESAFYAILPELLQRDENWYAPRHIVGKTPPKEKPLQLWKERKGDNWEYTKEPAPRAGEQTAFYRNHGQPLDEAETFWAMSPKEVETEYEPDLIDKIFPFSFFKSKK